MACLFRYVSFEKRCNTEQHVLQIGFVCVCVCREYASKTQKINIWYESVLYFSALLVLYCSMGHQVNFAIQRSYPLNTEKKELVIKTFPFKSNFGLKFTTIRVPLDFISLNQHYRVDIELFIIETIAENTPMCAMFESYIWFSLI